MGESFSREEELFAAALALPPVERSGYLERACGSDRELRARVDALLDALTPAEKFLEGDPWDLSAHRPAWSGGVAAPEGEYIGEYKLLRELGEGGGGVVYLAQQAAPVRRQVALKIVKPGMDTRALIARFEAERQTLAMMDHPNIARVYDAGATSSGRPYFVMELVRGIRITTYCEQTCIDVGERLGLFIQVCHAVAHAHQNGIIHCDIKPSNILVTLHDSVPVVKVIDFGIAKATYQESSQDALHMTLGPFVGTPAYVSPEQLEPTAQSIDARSDIYSLGVLLYELLTGCTPVDTGELMTVGLEEIRRRICEQEPPTPSQRFASLPPAAAMLAAQRRRTDAFRLARLLRGDLDWIVMRCLEKDRERRYSCVKALILDIQRFLQNEPVAARPPALAYKIRKFARRNRTVFVTGSAIAATMLVATAISIALAVYASGAQHRAQTEAATSKAIADFLQQDLLAQAAPDEEADRDLKLRTVLDRAADKIGNRFVGRPLVEAAIRETLGKTYDALGEYDTSYEHLRRAYELLRQQAGTDDARTLVAAGYLVSNLVVRGKLDEAEPLAVATLATQRRILGEEHRDSLESASNLASIYHQQGRYAAAAEIFERTLAIEKRVLGPDDRETLTTMNNLALSLRNQGELERAAKLHAEELERSTRVLGPEHPDTLTSMSNLAIVYTEQGRFAEATELTRRGCELSGRVAGPEHPETLTCLHNLASSLSDEGRFADARALQQQVVDSARRTLGPQSPQTLTFEGRLALIQAAQGESGQAERLAAHVIESSTQTLGQDHPLTLITMDNLARIYEDQNRFSEAEVLLRNVMAVAPDVFGQRQPRTLTFSDHLAEVLLHKGDYVGATDLLRKSLETRREKSPHDWRTFVAQLRLGVALDGLNRHEEAAAQLAEARAGLDSEALHIPAFERQRLALARE
ncbi:MAG TPA: serine/threonine-protein kinase [Povalibacter sp.]|nr:serine/threonine-protein kinase [Povalibacter sp.]